MKLINLCPLSYQTVECFGRFQFSCVYVFRNTLSCLSTTICLNPFLVLATKLVCLHYQPCSPCSLQVVSGDLTKLRGAEGSGKTCKGRKKEESGSSLTHSRSELVSLLVCWRLRRRSGLLIG